jgi:hypothetical protein
MADQFYNELLVKQYSSNISMLVQQQGSRLRNTVDLTSGKVGEEVFMDRIKKTSAQKVNTRFADTPFSEQDFDRRKVTPQDYDYGTLVDPIDMTRVLADPTSIMAQNAAYAMGRAIDELILDAALGTAYSGVDGSTPVSMLAGNTIAVNNNSFDTDLSANAMLHDGSAIAAAKSSSRNSGLTVGKLIHARKLLGANEAINYNQGSPGEIFLVCTMADVAALLRSAEVGSSDYNEIRPLMTGQQNQFMGFNFIVTELVRTKTSNSQTVNRCIAFQRQGIGLCIWRDVNTRIDPRPDKRYANQIYSSMTIGATRMEEERVIEIECNTDSST